MTETGGFDGVPQNKVEKIKTLTDRHRLLEEQKSPKSLPTFEIGKSLGKGPTNAELMKRELMVTSNLTLPVTGFEDNE